MRVLITLPWAKHVEFLRERKARHEIAESVRAAVSANAGHPAIFGYLVGNEIPSTMVRWLGVRRVTEFVEKLIRIGRAIDPDVLFSYATYPPTEYLLPQNVDFFCFNVYLHNQRDFERYLLRLQNLTEERPLILGEFGMDTIRHSQEEQAEMLGWHVDSVVKCGLAGTIFFSPGRTNGLPASRKSPIGRSVLSRASASRRKRSARFGKSSARTAPRCRIAIAASAICFGDCLFLQRRKDAGRLSRVVRQTQLSRLRSDPGR